MGMRKCSQCGNTGHNSRTCKSGNNSTTTSSNVKLFGVHISGRADDIRLKKSLSLPTFISSEENNLDRNIITNAGYNSDGLIHQKRKRKKGVPWSEEEHNLFILGLHKLGKGDWKGISNNFVNSRTATQVASHAQKYFLRQTNNVKSSTIFDITERNEQAIQPQVYIKESFMHDDCNFLVKNLTYPEIPNYCKLLTLKNSAAQNSPSLELTLAASSPTTCWG